MALSRKHYQAVAEAIARQARYADEFEDTEWRDGYDAGIEDAVFALTGVFQDDNRNFDQHRFIAACGLRQ